MTKNETNRTLGTKPVTGGPAGSGVPMEEGWIPGWIWMTAEMGRRKMGTRSLPLDYSQRLAQLLDFFIA